MKVVLVTKIKNLGNIGDIVDVKSGLHVIFIALSQSFASYR